jgi:hypothetical protein
MKRQWLWLLGLCCGSALSATLPDKSPDKHLGVASCASSLCHGSVTPSAHAEVLLNEFVTWSHQDSHAKAYLALDTPRGRAIAAKLGLRSAQEARICLTCHSDDVPEDKRGPKFALNDGIGCEACHGGAERWIASHAAKKATYAGDVATGMYPTANLHERAQLCASCHVGNADKQATHLIMGAGHPRLAFELDTFLALEPPHYRADEGYRRRKPAYNHTQTWAMGQLQASLQQLAALEQRSTSAALFPELSLFNCYACHDSSTQRSEWRRRALTQSMSPGTVPLNDAYWRMSWLIAKTFEPAAGKRVQGEVQEMQHAVASARDTLPALAAELSNEFRRLQQQVGGPQFTSARSRELAQAILEDGIAGEYRDYLGAEQAVMALELLLIDSGQGSRYRGQLDALYKSVKDIDSYRAEEFVGGLKSLQALMQ